MLILADMWKIQRSKQNYQHLGVGVKVKGEQVSKADEKPSRQTKNIFNGGGGTAVICYRCCIEYEVNNRKNFFC